MHERAKRWLAFTREDLRMADLAMVEVLWNQLYLHENMAHCPEVWEKNNARHYAAGLFEIGSRPRHP